jgi:transcriptional regulator with XRE-family HTH domain
MPRAPVRFREVFGRFLKESRGGMSQAELAERMGVAQTSVSAWEKGKGVSSEYIDLALDVLGIETDHAMKRIQEMAREARLKLEAERKKNPLVDVSGEGKEYVRKSDSKPVSGPSGEKPRPGGPRPRR